MLHVFSVEGDLFLMKNVIVTGAGGGMGNAICTLLSQKGCKVYGLDCRKPAHLPCPFLLCDVTNPDSVQQAFAEVKSHTGSVDAIVHTAGIYDLDSLVEIDEERFRRIFEINLFGVYRINKTFLPLLHKGSRIILTTSELAPLDPLPFTGIYAITKTALEKYAFSLRMELNLLGISVSVIRPGAVKTGLLGDSTRALDAFVTHTKLYPCNAKRFQAIVNSVESKSISPDEIARTVWNALTARHPKFVYNKNRNIALRLLHVLPAHLQVWIIQQILKN